MRAKKLKKLHCCEKCQNYWTCETKWYRGEHDRENICCSLCSSYESCWALAHDSSKNKTWRSARP